MVQQALGVLKGRGLVLSSSSLSPCPPAFSLIPSILDVIYPERARLAAWGSQMPPLGNCDHPGRGQRAGGWQRVPMGIALLLLLAAAAAGLSLQSGRMRHLGVCPNQLNPNLWVDAQSTCERECQTDQVSGAAQAGRLWGPGWVRGSIPDPPRRGFGGQVLSTGVQLAQLFWCKGLILAAFLPPGAPAVRWHQGFPGLQAKKTLPAPLLGPCTPPHCISRMLPGAETGWDQGNGQGTATEHAQPPPAPTFIPWGLKPTHKLSAHPGETQIQVSQ